MEFPADSVLAPARVSCEGYGDENSQERRKTLNEVHNTLSPSKTSDNNKALRNFNIDFRQRWYWNNVYKIDALEINLTTKSYSMKQLSAHQLCSQH